MKQITASNLCKRIKYEMDLDVVEKIQITYCCPLCMGGYKKEATETFGTDAHEVVKAIFERGSKVAIGRIYTAYTESDFRRTLFIDIVEL